MIGDDFRKRRGTLGEELSRKSGLSMAVSALMAAACVTEKGWISF